MKTLGLIYIVTLLSACHTEPKCGLVKKSTTRIGCPNGACYQVTLEIKGHLIDALTLDVPETEDYMCLDSFDNMAYRP